MRRRLVRAEGDEELEAESGRAVDLGQRVVAQLAEVLDEQRKGGGRELPPVDVVIFRLIHPLLDQLLVSGRIGVPELHRPDLTHSPGNLATPRGGVRSMLQQSPWGVEPGRVQVGIENFADRRERLEHVEAEAHVGHDQRQTPFGLEERLAVLQEADQVDSVLDDVRSKDVVVHPGTTDRLDQAAAVRDVVHLLDLSDLVGRDVLRLVLGDQHLAGRVVDTLDPSPRAFRDERVVRRTDLEAKP